MFEIVVVSIVLVIVFFITTFLAYYRAIAAEQIAKDAQSQLSYLVKRVSEIEFDKAKNHKRPDTPPKTSIQETSTVTPQTISSEIQDTSQSDGIFFEDRCHSDSLPGDTIKVDGRHIEVDSRIGDSATDIAKETTSAKAYRFYKQLSPKVGVTAKDKGSANEEPSEIVKLPKMEQRPEVDLGVERKQAIEKPVASNYSGVSNVDVDSLEIKLGTYWFVRIGVMLLLTGLALLAYYRKQFFVDLPPSVKVGGFYLLCIAMSGVGFWLSRTQEKLKNYGQVLIAGGFSGVYFTIYASHLFEPIKVIENLQVAVACLCIWGMFLIWISDRLQSEIMAIFTVGASYYATYIPLIHTGEISPWLLVSSNLILAVVSIGFMMKNRWIKLPSANMLVTYAGFIMTQFGWNVLPLQTLILFSISLWAVYSVAVFVAKNKDFNQLRRICFLTLNNAAMFGLIALAVVRIFPAMFWSVLISMSVVLFGMAMLANVFLKKDPLTAKAYAVQGILLLNLGIVTFDMSSSLLGPILAAEGLLFAMLSIRTDSSITRNACLILSLFATFFASFNMINLSGGYLRGGLIVAGFVLVSSGFFATIESSVRKLVRRQTGFIAFLGFFVGMTSLLFGFAHLPSLRNYSECLPLIVLSIPVVFLISNYRLQIREYVIFSQVCGILGVAISLFLAASVTTFSYPMLSCFLLTLGLVHWWYWQQEVFLNDCKGISVAKFVPNALNGLYSAGVVIQGIVVMFQFFGFGNEWMWMGAAIAVLVAFYSVTTRAFFLGLFAQLFLIGSSLKMLAVCLTESEPNAVITFVPIGAICLINLLVSTWQWRFAELTGLDQAFFRRMQMGLRLSAAALAFVWIQNIVPGNWLVLAYTFTGVAFFVLNSVRNNPDLRWISVAYSFLALISFLVQTGGGEAPWQSGFSLLIVMLFQQFARRSKDHVAISKGAHNSLIVVSSVLMMIWVTVQVSDFATIEIIGIRTLAWTGLGVVYFVLGLGLRERAYRSMGLVTLALALLSILPSIWSMSTKIKILSIFVMGGVFVALGFIYSRFKEPLQKLL